MDEISEKYLLALYNETNGRVGKGVDQHDVGKTIGLGLNVTDKVVQGLCNLGLAKVIGIGGDLAITEAGVEAIKKS